MTFNQDQAFPAGGAVPSTAQSVVSWWGLFETFVVFLLILLVSLWVIKRLNRADFRSMDASWAKVLDRQPLSAQQSLFLVEIAGQLQVLGGSDHHLLKICEINDADVAAEILNEIATRPVEKAGGWANVLNRLWPGHSQPKETFSEELDRLLEEVKK